MKTTIKNLIALSLTVVTTLGTAVVTKANDGHGKQLTVLTEVKKVTKINVSGNVEVVLMQSANESVNVYDNYYSKNALIQQKNNELRISSFEKQPLTVVVYINSLQEIIVSGNANLKTSGSFNTLYLDVYLNDNATATLNTSTVSLFTKLNVISNSNRPTVRPLIDRNKPTDNAIFGKAVWLSLRKIKRAASRHTSQCFCSTFNFAQPYYTTDKILPNRPFFTVYLTC